LKIAVANNRYFVSGGPERYMFNVSNELELRGHVVIPFAINYAQNHPTPWSRYFPDPPSQNRSAVYYRELRLSMVEKARLAARSIYSFESRRRFSQLLSDTRPDLAYLLGIANMLTPSLVDAAFECEIPAVMFVLDYNIGCASYHYLRDGRVCQSCKHGKYHAVQFRCVQKSTTLSALRVIAMKAHEISGVYQRVAAFVAPSLTMKRELADIGLSSAKIHHIPYPVDLNTFQPEVVSRGPITFVGRLSAEKGVDTLLRAYAQLPPSTRPPLWIIGGDSGGLARELAALAGELDLTDAQFLGQLKLEEVADRLRKSFAIVVPSRWLENSPNTVYEAMASGKPVVATRLGSMTEQVTDGVTGYTFPVDDDGALAAALSRLLDDPAQAIEMGRRGRCRVEDENSLSLHVDRLLAMVEQVKSQ
jgi:glycosyltransferase involved in cell wall biosynthesis